MQHTETIAINMPVEDVWDLVGNPNSWPKWMDRLTDVKLNGPVESGSPISYSWRDKQQSGKVIAFLESQEISVKAEQSGFDVTESIIVHGIGDMTNVSLSMIFEPKTWWAKAADPLMLAGKKVFIGMPLRKSLKNLRDQVEVRQAQAA